MRPILAISVVLWVCGCGASPGGPGKTSGSGVATSSGSAAASSSGAGQVATTTGARSATTGVETTTGGPQTSGGGQATASGTTSGSTSANTSGSGVGASTGGSTGGTTGPSPNCTVITGAGETLSDAQGNAWTIAGGVVQENGSAAGYSADVIELAYVGGKIYQENATHGWWVWSSGTWVTATDPTGTCGGSGTSGGPSGTAGASTSGTSSTGGATAGDGTFHVANGQIIGPDGQPFVGKGIDVPDSQMSAVSTSASAQPLTSLFPGLTIVRLACYAYNDPSSYQPFVDQLTALGIVVEMEDHQSSDGVDSGGGTGVVFTGQLLQQELSWYSALAAAFADNPYVWFGTDNEPPENPSAAALSTWQQQTYQAVRNAGANNIVLIEMNCDTNPSDCGAGYTDSVYASMTNVAWDSHYYGWLVNYSTDPTTIANSIAANATAAQLITSADGVMPIVISGYGNSTDGQSTDANGTQVVTAVEQSGYTSMAWWWGGGSGDIDNLTDNGSLTDYGQQVAQYIAQ